MRGRDEAPNYTKLLPGLTVLQAVSYLGYRLNLTALGIAWDVFTDGWPYSGTAALALCYWPYRPGRTRS